LPITTLAEGQDDVSVATLAEGRADASVTSSNFCQAIPCHPITTQAEGQGDAGGIIPCHPTSTRAEGQRDPALAGVGGTSGLRVRFVGRCS